MEQQARKRYTCSPWPISTASRPKPLYIAAFPVTWAAADQPRA